MIRHFDPIDILFIVLISCYLITFFAIVLFFLRKYLIEHKNNNRPFKELIFPETELTEKIKKTKNKGKRKTKPKATNLKKVTSKTGNPKNKNLKNSQPKKKGPNNSKRTSYGKNKSAKRKKDNKSKKKINTKKKLKK